MKFEFFTRDFPVKKTRASLARAAFRRVFLYNHGGRRSIAGIKESFKGNAARARLARGFIKEIPYKL